MAKPLKNKIHSLRRVSQILFFALFVFLITGTVCSLLIPGGAFITCPLGALQIILSSETISATIIISALVLVAATILLGRAFCSWVCPIGLIMDMIDAVIDRLKLPQFFKRHNLRIVELIRNKFTAYGILTSTLIGSSILKYPVFCAFCPLGTICRGAAQGGCIISGGLEMALVPAVGALSLGEKRFWCKYLCPVGILLSIFSKINILVKPVVNEMKCVDWKIVKRICPNCENLRGTNINEIPLACKACDACSSCNICREICPEDIDFANNPTANSYCTKCLECYIKCPRDAIQIKPFNATIDLKRKISLLRLFTGCGLKIVKTVKWSPCESMVNCIISAKKDRP